MSYYELRADENDYFSFFQADELVSYAHFHKASELVVVIDGEIEACISGVKRRLKKGEACFASSFDVHYYVIPEKALVYVFVLSSNYLSEFDAFMSGRKMKYFLTVDEKLMNYLDGWYQTIEEKENRLMLTSRILYLLGKLALDNPPERRAEKEKNFSSDIFGYINKNFKSKISVAEIADKFGYSRGYVSTMISTYTGGNFNTYVNRLRILHIKNELDKKDGRTVLEIALSSGFDSPNTFYRAYKKQYGTSPKANKTAVGKTLFETTLL